MVLAAARRMGTELPDEGDVRAAFDDPIITDTAAEKKQDAAEVAACFMCPWEYRMRWYVEDEETVQLAMKCLRDDTVRHNPTRD